MTRVTTTEQRQAFEVGPQIRSSSTDMRVKNEKSKRAILAALGDTELQKILDATMFRCGNIMDIKFSYYSQTNVVIRIRRVYDTGLDSNVAHLTCSDSIDVCSA